MGTPTPQARRRRAVVVGLPLLALGLFATLLLPRLVSAAPVAQDRPGPVLLVPGFGGGTGALQPLASALRSAGREVQLVALPDGGTGDLARQADVLDEQVRGAVRGGAPSVDLVGYSAGGVVVRLWAARHDGAAYARRVVTLGSPHHGAGLADLGLLVGGGVCPEACRELATGSALLRGLAAGDETPDGPRWTSVWSAADDVVTPPDSARLAGARNVRIQDVCPRDRVDHGGLPADPPVVGLVLETLGPDTIGQPGPADCAALSVAGQVSS